MDHGRVRLATTNDDVSQHGGQQKFISFGTTFRPSFVTVHKCDGRDLGSISLKRAADSFLNVAVKYVYPDRHFVGESERISFRVAKGEKSMRTEATDVTVVPET